VVFMPFFPNTGDSEERVEDLNEQIAQLASANEDLTASQAELEAQIASLRAQIAELEAVAQEAQQAQEAARDAGDGGDDRSLPPVDVMILVDTTGSMRNEVAGLRADAVALAEILEGISDSAAMGIIGFKDRCEPNTIRHFTLRPLTGSNVRELGRFARTLEARSERCNRDSEEALDRALILALQENWRSDSSQHVIVVISDNAAYPERQAAVLAAAAQFAASRNGRRISTVFAQTGDSRGTGEAFLRELADEGGGEFVPTGGSFIGSVLKAIVT
jgi:Mg-chelatase subunit ChlD